MVAVQKSFFALARNGDRKINYGNGGQGTIPPCIRDEAIHAIIRIVRKEMRDDKDSYLDYGKRSRGRRYEL